MDPEEKTFSITADDVHLGCFSCDEIKKEVLYPSVWIGCGGTVVEMFPVPEVPCPETA